MWSPFGIFWSVKYLNFEQKLPIRIAQHIFLGSRQPEVTITVNNAFCPPRVAKKGISLWTNTSVQMCLYPLFQNQSSHFLLSSLFWKLSQLLCQDQQNSQQIYCQLPIIFLWTPKGFISPESFLNFLLNLYIPPQIHLWVKKLNLLNFTHAPKQNFPPGFYHYPSGRRKLPIPPEQHFLNIYFPEKNKGGEGGKGEGGEGRRRGEDYVAEKITKINKGFGHKFW